jgi:diguanylate cyclase (GGDEF)-like protein
MNRLAFHTWVEQVCERNGEPNLCLVLMLIDLDKFKQVNDTLGHLVGDKVLQHVAARLQNCVRKGDLVARLGGDEFAIVFECDRKKAKFIAEKNAKNVVCTMAGVFDIDGKIVDIGASIGICVSLQGEFELNRVITSADFALYHAKENGRGNYCFHDSSFAALPDQASRDIMKAGSGAKLAS